MINCIIFKHDPRLPLLLLPLLLLVVVVVVVVVVFFVVVVVAVEIIVVVVAVVSVFHPVAFICSPGTKREACGPDQSCQGRGLGRYHLIILTMQVP